MKKVFLLLACSSFLLNAAENDENQWLTVKQTAQAVAQTHAQGHKSVENEINSLGDLLISAGKEHKIAIDDIYKILDCANFAGTQHFGQKRKNSALTPYIIHPTGVANAIMRHGECYDPRVIMAALLHDTIEDTKTTFEDIEAKFGKEVCDLVAEVTEDKTKTRPEREQWWIDSAASKSIGACYVLLADKTYNMIDMIHNPPVGWSNERIFKKFAWTKEVITRLNISDENPLKKRALEMIEHNIDLFKTEQEN